MTREDVRQIVVEMFRDGTLSLEESEIVTFGYGASELRRKRVSLVFRGEERHTPEVLTEVSWELPSTED
jgi:hypothetical protein